MQLPQVYSDNAYQLNNAAQYNYDTSSPYYQMITQYSDAQKNMVDATNAQMLDVYKQRLAQQAAAQAQAEQAAALNAEANYLRPYTPVSIGSITHTEAVNNEAPGFFDQVVGRAIPETLGTLQGGLGALSDVVGMDAARDYFLERAQANFAQAQETAPRQVGRIEDIKTASDLGTWATETAADLLPSIVGTALTAGGGALAAGSGLAARAGLAGSIRSMASKQAAEYVSKGVTRDVAEQMAKDAVTNTLRRRGAMAGVFGFTGAQETGSAYLDNVNTHGVDEASSLRAMGTGAVSAAITTLLGIEGGLVKGLTGVAVGEATEQAVKRNIINGMLRGAGREGGEEALQETVQAVNRSISDDRVGTLTVDDISSIINSAAAGALFGGPGGGVNTFLSNRKIAQTPQEKNATSPSVQQEFSPITTPSQRAMSSYEVVQAEQQRAINTAQQEYTASMEPIMKALADKQAEMQKYSSASKDPQVILMDAEKRREAENKARKEYFDLLGARTKFEVEHRSNLDKVKKDAEQNLKKVQSELITDNTIAQSNQFWSDPVAFSNLTSSGQDAIRYVARQQSALTDKSNSIHKRIADINKELGSESSVRRNRKATKALHDERTALHKDLKSIESTMSKLNQSGAKVRNMLSKPSKDFSPQKLDAELNKIYYTAMPTGVDMSNTLADSGTYSMYNSSMNMMEENVDKLIKQTQDSIRYIEGRQAANEANQMSSNIADPLSTQNVATNPGIQRTPAQPTSAFPSTPDSFLSQNPQVGMPYQQLALPRITSYAANTQATPMYASATDTANEFARRDYLRERAGVQRTGIAPADMSTEASIPVGPAVERPAIPEVTSVGRASATPTPEAGTNLGTTTAAKRVYQAIHSTLKQMPGLGRVTVVVDTVQELNNPNIDPMSLGAYDPATNRVYLFAENIEAQSRVKSNKSKPNAKTIKNIAARTLVHEGVVHYGLSTLMNQSQRDAFLKSVQDSFANDALYQRVQAQYAGSTPLQIAEEFVARLAERETANNLLNNKPTDTESSLYKKWWDKTVKLFTDVLKKIGFSNITKNDVMDVLRAASANLSQDTTSTIMSSPIVREGGVVSSLPEGAPFPDVDGRGPNERQLDRQPTSITARFKNLDKEKFIEQVVDAKRPLQRLTEEVKSRTGGIITSDNDVFEVQEGMSNAMSARMKQFVATHVDPMLDLIVDMTPQGQDVKTTFAQVADFVTAQAAIERNAAKGGDVSGAGFSTAESLKILERLNSPEMARVSDMLQALNNARLDILEKEKLQPKEMLDNWRAKYNLYMPLKTWSQIMERENASWYSSPTRKSLSLATRQTRIASDALGTDKDIDNAVTHAILQAFDVIAFSENVKPGRALLKMVEDNKSFTDLFELKRAYLPEEGSLKRTIDNEGEVKWKSVEFNTQEYPGKVVQVIDDNANRIEIILKPEGLATAFKGENIAQLSKPMRAMSQFRRNLSKLFTVYNPMFWLRNPIRDLATAIVNYSDVSYKLRDAGVSRTWDMAKQLINNGFLTMLSNKGLRKAIQHAVYTDGVFDKATFDNFNPEVVEYMKHWDDFVKYGGKSTYFSSGGYDQYTIDLQKELENKRPSTTTQAVRARMNKLGKYMESVSDALENQTRFIAYVETYKALEKVGRNPDGSRMSTTQAKMKAANVAINLTVNFTKKGAAAPAFDALYMFASANIAGNARLLETILRKDKATGKYDKGHIAKFLSYPMMAYAAQAMLARMMMPEDDDGINEYDKIPDYIKDSNIILPLPGTDGKYLTIPVAYGLNVFWAMARNMADATYAEAAGTKGPSFTDAATKSIMASFDNFSPMGSVSSEGLSAFVPTIFRPLAQLYTNKNFAGNPIMPESTHLVRGELPDSQKAWSTTGPVYKLLAEGINEIFGGSTTRSGMVDISPETIEHLMTSYLGGFGRIAGTMANTLVKFNEDSLTEDDVIKLPGISAFLRSSQDSDTSAIFTRARTELQTQLNTAEEARTNLNLSPQERYQVLRENQAGIRSKAMLNRSQKQLNDIRSKEKRINNDPKLSQNTKNKQLEQLQKRKMVIMKDFIKNTMELGVGVN